MLFSLSPNPERNPLVDGAVNEAVRLTHGPLSQRKCRESKAEANAAQNKLEKEITTLRDSNRTLQLRLRDIEVANDDFERQARNTTSSLEDLESKYNVAIERAVMMEEEIKQGEQERETLRVEAQRLREELSDLKIEAEILQDKIKKQESRHLSAISTDISVLESSMFDQSPNSTASSPLITTPPADSKSVSTAETVSEVQDPPSPPMSDASAPLSKPKAARTPALMAKKSRLPSLDNSITPKPKHFSTSTSASTSRAPAPRIATTSGAFRTPGPRPLPTRAARATSHKIPASNSLTHIRSLTAQMQRLEARVQSVRSKLPAPVATPPRASPRNSALGTSSIPSTVTIRSRKRTLGGSTAASSVAGGDDVTPTNFRHGETAAASAAPDFRSSTSSMASSKAGGGKSHVPRLSTSGVSRLSFGPLPNRNPVDPDGSRPSSRASMSSSARPVSRADSQHDSRCMPPPRPVSRTSLGGARTPLGGRPRSSLGGHGGGGGGAGGLHSGHGHSQSVSYSTAELDELMLGDGDTRTPSRRGTYSRFETEAAGTTGIPLPGSRRQSGGGSSVAIGRRSSSSGLRDPGGTGPRGQKLADVGET